MTTAKNTLREKKELDACTICLDKPVDSIMIPCGHMAVCAGCSEDLRDKKCPICNKPNIQVFRVYRG